MRKPLYLALGLQLLGGQFAFAQATAAGNELIVQTQAGQVRGQSADGVLVFRSIPYAAPPVGDLRFAAPTKHQPWSEVRDARQIGSSAPFNRPQSPDMDDEPVMGSGWVKGDDYLTTSIWTPSVAGPRLPVIVYIHGGAFVLGTSNVPLFNGANFAKQGVVLVTLNYRMGIEGFLKINGVPSNLGIRDQIAALRWVKDNITQFGGDPENVTVAGESAGGMSVAVLVASPATTGLFKRAIMMSGSGQAVLTGEQADRIAAKYAQVLKIKNNAAAYRRFTPEELLAAQKKVTPRMVRLKTEEAADPSAGFGLFFPVIDGDIIPNVPLTSVQKGAGSNVDMLIGYNTDEANYFLVPTGLMKKIKLNFVLNKAAGLVHPTPSALTAVYKKAYPQKSLGEIFSSIATAYQFQVPSVRYADAHTKLPGKTYMYEFNWASSVAGGAYGAFHGVELPFVFNNLDNVKGPRSMLGPAGGPPALATKVQTAWADFAKAGSPGWDVYAPGERKTMLINTAWQVQTNPHAKELQAWEGVR